MNWYVDVDKLLSQKMPSPLAPLSQNSTAGQLTPFYRRYHDSHSSRCCSKKKKKKDIWACNAWDRGELKDAQTETENKRKRLTRKVAADW